MIYLDSSALVKLVVAEAESNALRKWLRTREDRRVSSELARVEVTRAARLAAMGSRTEQSIADVFAGLALMPIGREVLARANRMEPANLRTLDAIHLASAALLGVDTTVVSYDARLSAGVHAAGLTVATPR